MKNLFAICLVMCTLAVHAQHREKRNLSDFQGIAVSSGIDATFNKSSENSATIDVENPEVASKLDVSVRNGILYLRVKPNSQINHRGKLRITINGKKDINRIKLSSAGRLEIASPLRVGTLTADVSSSAKLTTTAIQADEVTLDVSSSGSIAAQVEAENLTASISSSAKLRLSGKARTIDLRAASAGKGEFREFRTSQAKVSVKSAAAVELQVSDTLNAHASSGGSLRYWGSPATPNLKESSGGRIQHKS